MLAPDIIWWCGMVKFKDSKVVEERVITGSDAIETKEEEDRCWPRGMTRLSLGYGST